MPVLLSLLIYSLQLSEIYIKPLFAEAFCFLKIYSAAQ